MKNLKTTILGVLCVIAGASSHGMNTPPGTATKPYTTCYLGERYSDLPIAYCEYKRDIIADGSTVGQIHYKDYLENGVCERYIEKCTISHEHLKGHGIGTLCMKQFLKDAQEDCVDIVTLLSTSRAVNLYTRLGFTVPEFPAMDPYSPWTHMQKKIDRS